MIYRIVEIQDFPQLQNYRDYTEWCIIYSEMAYDYYLEQGKRRLLIFERDDYMKNSKEEGIGFPYDSFGLSLIAVILNEDGTLYSVTTRWNSLDEDEEGLGRKVFLELLGMNTDSSPLISISEKDIMEKLNENPRFVIIMEEEQKTLLRMENIVNRIFDKLDSARFDSAKKGYLLVSLTSPASNPLQMSELDSLHHIISSLNSGTEVIWGLCEHEKCPLKIVLIGLIHSD